MDHAARDQSARFRRVEGREQLAILVLHAFDVTQQDQFFRLERGSDLARRSVGIDVVSLAVAAESGRCDHRDEVVRLERPQQFRIDAIDFADQPDIDEHVSPDRPWIVLVWNDPINLMSYVTFVFQKIFGYSLEKATELMLDVHHKGRAVVSNGAREKAEMDVFKLHEHGLWATMQHDE